MKSLRVAVFPILFAFVAVLMVGSVLADRADPNRTWTLDYKQVDSTSMLLPGLWAISFELVLLLGILRPWSTDRSWVRPFAALFLFIPWTAFSVLVTLGILRMNSAGVAELHLFWLLCVDLILVGSAIRARIDAQRAPSAPPGS